jgi:heme exporter protein D
MSAHALYVAAAYGISAVTLIGLAGWILFDYRARQQELAELEARGVRRRSERRPGAVE